MKNKSMDPQRRPIRRKIWRYRNSLRLSHLRYYSLGSDKKEIKVSPPSLLWSCEDKTGFLRLSYYLILGYIILRILKELKFMIYLLGLVWVGLHHLKNVEKDRDGIRDKKKEVKKMAHRKRRERGENKRKRRRFAPDLGSFYTTLLDFCYCYLFTKSNCFKILKDMALNTAEESTIEVPVARQENMRGPEPTSYQETEVARLLRLLVQQQVTRPGKVRRKEALWFTGLDVSDWLEEFEVELEQEGVPKESWCKELVINT